jgi:hypothetical protein
MDIEKLLNEIKNQLLELAKNNYQDVLPQFQKDMNTFFEFTKLKLERWSVLITNSSITIEEFEWLVKSQQEFLVLATLQKAGLSKIKINKLKNTIIKIIVSSTSKMVLGV